MTPAAPESADRLTIYHIDGAVGDRFDTHDGRFLGNWEEDGVSFLFFNAPADAAVDALVRRRPELALVERYDMRYDEWQGAVPDDLRVGALHIRPPQSHAPPPLGGHLIRLDPGVVFGTGTHPTTRDCLLALQVAFDHLVRPTVVDAGTGSGVLALAAARLGARRVLALDPNMLAVRTAGRNIRLNQLQDRIMAVRGRAGQEHVAIADLLVANLHYDALAPLLAGNGWERQRWFVLSGLLRSHAREVVDRLRQLGARLLRRWVHDGTWFTFLGQGRPG